MKRIIYFIFLLSLLSVYFAYAEENAEKQDFLSELRATVGVVGIGYLFPINPAIGDMFVPNLGGIMRITYPLVKYEKSPTDSTTFLDTGLCAFVTGGAAQTEGIFLIGLGVTLGLYEGFISLSCCPTFVVGPDRNDIYLGFLFTSDSLTF